MDSGAAAHGETAQEDGQQVGKGLTRLPAETPRTPGPKGVNFQAVLWELVFEHVLRQCGYLTDFHTVYVMVDTSQGENGTTTLPHFRIYGAASCAPHLGGHLCSGSLGGCISWDQLRIAGQ